MSVSPLKEALMHVGVLFLPRFFILFAFLFSALVSVKAQLLHGYPFDLKSDHQMSSTFLKTVLTLPKF